MKAQLDLAWYWFMEVSHGLVESYYWFRKAAENGDPDAQLFVAELLWDFPELRDEQIRWIRLSAQSGNEEALELLKQNNSLSKNNAFPRWK